MAAAEDNFALVHAIGTRKLPMRVFVEPDLNVLLEANTNAGDKLRRVAARTITGVHPSHGRRARSVARAGGVDPDPRLVGQLAATFACAGYRRGIPAGRHPRALAGLGDLVARLAIMHFNCKITPKLLISEPRGVPMGTRREGDVRGGTAGPGRVPGGTA